MAAYACDVGAAADKDRLRLVYFPRHNRSLAMKWELLVGLPLAIAAFAGVFYFLFHHDHGA